MNKNAFLIRGKDLQQRIIDCVNSNNGDDTYYKLERFLDENDILQDLNSFEEVLLLISKIYDSYHQSAIFIDNILQILEIIKKKINNQDKIKIFDRFRNNRSFLILLFKAKILCVLTPKQEDDRQLMKRFFNKSDKQGLKFSYFLYPEFKDHIDKRKKRKIINEFAKSKVLKLLIKKDVSNQNISQQSEQEFLSGQYKDETFLQNLNQEELNFALNKIQSDEIKNIFNNPESVNIDIISKNPEFDQFKYLIRQFKVEKYLGILEDMCLKRENEHEICSIIRNDSVEKFNNQINQLSLLESKPKLKFEFDMIIQPSLLESNRFLSKHQKITLIDYAAFYGSYNIFMFLVQKVELSPSTLLYAIHGRNIKIINFILEKNIVKDDEFYINCYNESIKCYLNDVAKNIRENFLQKYEDRFDEIQINSYRFCNYDFLPESDCLIPSSIIKLNDFVFKNFKQIIEISIPDSVNYIENNAFQGCTLLQKVTIPPSVKSIGDFVFKDCSSLSEISIPSSVESFGNGIFNGVISLKILGDIDMIPKNFFKDCNQLKKISIPSSVTAIRDGAFNGCTSLSEISIPSSVKSFGIDIFFGVKSLKITGDIGMIPNNFFEHNNQLKKITVDSSVTSIGDGAFEDCKSLIKCSIPPSVTAIGICAFHNCLNLNEITIPPLLTEICDKSFFLCISLTELTIPKSVTSIGNYAFSNCKKITEITIPASVTSIGDFAFNRCKLLKKVSFDKPSSLKSMGKGAFKRCESLEKIEIPSYITTINEGTFYECTSLLEASIPSVAYIGDYAFYKCESLTNVLISSNLAFSPLAFTDFQKLKITLH